LAAPYHSFFVGQVPASGEFSFQYAAPRFAAPARIYYCQAVFRDASSGRHVVSAPTALVRLDSGL
jgi:hypothetical protein